MARYSDIIRDAQTKAPIAGVYVSVIDNATGAAAALTDDSGGTFKQPLMTDTFGAYYFNSAVDYVQLVKSYGGRVVEKDNIYLTEPNQSLANFLYEAGAIDAPTLQALADLLISLQGGGGYVPAMKFNNARNSQYVPLVS